MKISSWMSVPFCIVAGVALALVLSPPLISANVSDSPQIFLFFTGVFICYFFLSLFVPNAIGENWSRGVGWGLKNIVLTIFIFLFFIPIIGFLLSWGLGYAENFSDYLIIGIIFIAIAVAIYYMNKSLKK